MSGFQVINVRNEKFRKLLAKREVKLSIQGLLFTLRLGVVVLIYFTIISASMKIHKLGRENMKLLAKESLGLSCGESCGESTRGKIKRSQMVL